MPQKIRDMLLPIRADLERAGFKDRGGKGSHRNYVHPKVSRPVTISERPGDDAKQYQIRAVERALRDVIS